MEYQRYFSVEQAEDILPTVKQLLLDLRILRDTITKFMDAVEHEPEFFPMNDDGIYFCQWREVNNGQEFHKLQYEFYNKMHTLMRMGCLIRNLDKGIIDFPAQHKRREIFLCWKLGENKVTRWHEIDKCGQENKDVMKLVDP